VEDLLQVFCFGLDEGIVLVVGLQVELEVEVSQPVRGLSLLLEEFGRFLVFGLSLRVEIHLEGQILLLLFVSFLGFLRC
jgi:hypothetical protein